MFSTFARKNIVPPKFQMYIPPLLDQLDSNENILRTFWKIWTLRVPRFFFGKLKTCSIYEKHSPRSWEQSAIIIMAGRSLKHFIFTKVPTTPYITNWTPLLYFPNPRCFQVSKIFVIDLIVNLSQATNSWWFSRKHKSFLMRFQFWETSRSNDCWTLYRT